MLCINPDGSKDTLRDSLLSYLTAKAESNLRFINPSLESSLRELAESGVTLACACNAFQARLHLRLHAKQGYILARDPDTSALHSGNCRFHRPEAPLPAKLNYEDVVNALIDTIGCKVCFPPRVTDRPLYERWTATISKVRKSLPILSERLFCGIPQYRSALEHSRAHKTLAIWVDIAKTEKIQGVRFYGSESVRGPLLLVTLIRDGGAILKVSIPVASFTIPFLVFNQFERDLVLRANNLLPAGMRIESGIHPLFKDGRRYYHAFRFAYKGVKDVHLVITGAKDKSRSIADAVNRNNDRDVTAVAVHYDDPIDQVLKKEIEQFNDRVVGQ